MQVRSAAAYSSPKPSRIRHAVPCRASQPSHSWAQGGVQGMPDVHAVQLPLASFLFNPPRPNALYPP